MSRRKGEIIWTTEKIKNGFEKFFKEFGKYPTVLEIDKYLSLPSSRQLQRRWPGGVRYLREELGLDITDFTKGETRSITATSIGERGKDKEREIQKILIEHFGEICVHEQKPYSDYSGRFDFVVYTKNKKFAVDTFFPVHRNSLTGCINSKQKLYKNIDFEIILLQMNENISQEYMDKLLNSKKNPLPKNIKVLNLKNFLDYIKTIESLKINNN